MKQRFSDRMGLTTLPTVLQADDINMPLRNRLWNMFLVWRDSPRATTTYTMWVEFTRVVAERFSKVAVDTVPLGNQIGAHRWLKQQYDSLPWHGVYNLLEFLVEELPRLRQAPFERASLAEYANQLLEEELSAYRFVEGALVPISNPAEIAAIQHAAEAAAQGGLDGVHTHIVAALQLFGRRPTPDYRNSVKESISAVESAASYITGSEKADLRKALAILEGPIQLHGALKAGFLSLYGYSSDEGGIRHALLEESSTVGFDEAKFMLVSCSAFATFLITKASAAGLIGGRS